MQQIITLQNTVGMKVGLSNLGARITSILMPTHKGVQQMLATYEADSDFLEDTFYLGASCGRVCNRIAKGRFELEGKEYQVTQNDGENCLHGGSDNFAMRYWQVDKVSNEEVVFTLVSADGDQGFPGGVNVKARYLLDDANRLSIFYSATTSKACPINLTNHAYFNLGEADISQLELKINATAYLAKNEHNIPTGEQIALTGDDFDFRDFKQIGHTLKSAKHPAIAEQECIDHCYVLAPNTPAAELVSKRNQVKLTVQTNQLGLQLYTGKYLSGKLSANSGLCLEAQNFPDAVNQPGFPDSVLLPQQTYHNAIHLQFYNCF